MCECAPQHPACEQDPPCQSQSHAADAAPSWRSCHHWQLLPAPQPGQHVGHAGQNPTDPWQGHAWRTGQTLLLLLPLQPPPHPAPGAPYALAGLTATPADHQSMNLTMFSVFGTHQGSQQINESTSCLVSLGFLRGVKGQWLKSTYAVHYMFKAFNEASYVTIIQYNMTMCVCTRELMPQSMLQEFDISWRQSSQL